jgi:hypothetical protein
MSSTRRHGPSSTPDSGPAAEGSRLRPARRDRALGPELPIPRQAQDVVERATSLRRGLAFLRRAPAEVVAATLGVHARAVEEARSQLEDPPARERLLRVFARALEERRGAAPAPPAPPAAAARSPDDLIQEAERHALGLDFLHLAPPETVAITFEVHPDTVLRAREILASRGHAPTAAGEDA